MLKSSRMREKSDKKLTKNKEMIIKFSAFPKITPNKTLSLINILKIKYKSSIFLHLRITLLNPGLHHIRILLLKCRTTSKFASLHHHLTHWIHFRIVFRSKWYKFGYLLKSWLLSDCSEEFPIFLDDGLYPFFNSWIFYFLLECFHCLFSLWLWAEV